MNIFLVRHTSVNVPPGICYGQTDVPVNETFEQEADEVATAIKSLSEQPFERVYCSPLTRCRKLADHCGYRHDYIVDNRIMEMNFGEWEMQEFEKIKDPRLNEWYNDYLHVTATGGESFRQQLSRVSSFIDEVRTLQVPRHSNILVFTHGGVIICAQVYAGLIKPQEAFSSLTPYGGIVEISF